MQSPGTTSTTAPRAASTGRARRPGTATTTLIPGTSSRTAQTVSRSRAGTTAPSRATCFMARGREAVGRACWLPDYVADQVAELRKTKDPLLNFRNHPDSRKVSAKELDAIDSDARARVDDAVANRMCAQLLLLRLVQPERRVQRAQRPSQARWLRPYSGRAHVHRAWPDRSRRTAARRTVPPSRSRRPSPWRPGRPRTVPPGSGACRWRWHGRSPSSRARRRG